MSQMYTKVSMLFDFRQAQNVLLEAIAKTEATSIADQEVAEIKSNVRMYLIKVESFELLIQSC